MTISAGRRITAGMFTSTASGTQDAASTFTSTPGYTETGTGNPFVSTTFVAPASGEVTVSLQAFVDNSTSARTTFSFNIREGGVVGSGNLFYSGDDEEGIANLGSDDSRHGSETHVTGLTPGDTYNVRGKGRVSSASTGTVQHQHLIVKPCF